jgi:hypothetical protein
MNKRWLVILLLLPLTLFLYAHEETKAKVKNDSVPVYQGVSLKLDIAMPVIEAARSAGKIQDYEMAINVRLKNRFYPTLELGYALAECGADGAQHKGQGGFARLGMDLAIVKKGATENNFMIGLRFGGAYQNYDLTNVRLQTDYWLSNPIDFYNQTRFDCWGELVAGCQVYLWKGLHMGWYGRIKLLMTRSVAEGNVLPYYVPGLGFRNDFNWGINYYIGYRF